MRGLWFLVALLGACTGSGTKPSAKAVELADSIMQAKQIPGMAISVMRDGRFLWSGGFGHADLEQDVHVDPGTTKFRIGSISKSLTAVGLAKLVADGKIYLDSSIYFYLPDFPKKKWRPTVRQVASHTGGIRHYNGDEFQMNRRFSSVTEGLSIFEDDSLMCRPGTEYNYSTYGYNLLGAIIEKTSGESFVPWMNKNVIEPMDLQQTVPDFYDSLIPSRAQPYERTSTGWINSPTVDNSYKWAGGGYLSTSEDLVRFGQAVLTHRVISEEALNEFIQPYRLSNGELTAYGLGWSLRTEDGRKTFGHSGGSVGGTSRLILYPEEGLIVSVVTNLSSADLGDFPFDIADLFLDKRE